MKKSVALVLALVMMLSLASCGSSEGNGDKTAVKNPDVVMVTDEMKLGDNGFNDECWAGCERAADELGVEIYCIESESAEKYADSIAAAVSMEPQLVICAGSNLKNALVDVALAHPDQKFAIINANQVGDNVAGITFSENEGAFLAGIAAAMTSESKIVSFIGGEPSMTSDKFQYGFEAGVATIDAGIYVNNQYIGSYDDEEQAKTIAGAHAALGSDVIYHAAGAAGNGVIKAAENNDVWVIGTDVDQSYISEDAVLCSAIKKADSAAFEIIKKVCDGSFDGEDAVYTIAQDAVGLSDLAGNLSEDAASAVKTYAEKIKNGEIAVPYDWQSCYNYRTSLSQE